MHPLTVICCWSQDKTSGRIFYVNHRTGEQTGQRPEEMNSHIHKGTGLKGMEGEEGHRGANATLYRLKMSGVATTGNSDSDAMIKADLKAPIGCVTNMSSLYVEDGDILHN